MRIRRAILFALVALLLPTLALAQWQLGGIRVTTQNSAQALSAICSDGAGGSIVTWLDSRNSLANWDVYAQRFDAAGNRLWTDAGLPICTVAIPKLNVAIAPDGAGGAIIVWTDTRFTIFPLNGGNALIAQHVNAAGVRQWPNAGVVVYNAAYNTTPPVMVSDGAGGAVIAWRDNRTQTGADNIYTQRINGAGTLLWPAAGVALCTAVGLQSEPRIASDAAGGAIVAWTDARNAADPNIYARRITSAGSPQWAADGLAICTATGTQLQPVIVADGLGGAVIGWSDGRNGVDVDLYARRVTGAGSLQWTVNGSPVTTATGDQWFSTAVPAAGGGAIFAWRDDRADRDIYAQRLSGTGVAQWAPGGVPVAVPPTEQSDPVAVTDGSGGAVIAWRDDRLGGDEAFAQRVDSAGVAMWSSNGVPVAVGAATTDHAMLPDNLGHAVLTWTDNGTGFVRAQLLTSALGQAPAVGTYLTLPAAAADALVADVDLRPHATLTLGPRSFLPLLSNLHVVNTTTNALELVLPLPSASVQGIDFVHHATSPIGVMMTSGHVRFYGDVTAPVPATIATFTHTDTPIPDCDPFFVEAGGFVYCVVSYVGSVRVFRIAGLVVTDLYTTTRSSIGLEAVDVQTNGIALLVPNSTSIDFITLATGATYSSVTLAFPPKREVDLAWIPAVGDAYWPLDGAILRIDPAGFIESTIAISGTSVEGVDLAWELLGSMLVGAYPTTGFTHILDLASGTLLASCPTPGAVVRNFDPLISPHNLTGPVDGGVVYWSVIGTTYVIDVSSPGAPFATLDTPGGLVDGCDLTASNDRTRAVLPHPGLAHVLDLVSGSVLGIIYVSGDLIMDVDPIFPPALASPAIGSRVSQPHPGGILVVSGFTGDADQCVMTTTDALYVLNLATLSINQTFPLSGLVEGVDPVIVQGALPPFDYNTQTARDVDQDFLCHESQRIPYYCRPLIDPGVYTDWHDMMRLGWYRWCGFSSVTYFDSFAGVRATVLSDRQTIVFNDLQGNFIANKVTSSPIVGGFVANRDKSYVSVFTQDKQEIPIEMIPLSLVGIPPPPPPPPPTPGVNFGDGLIWPMVGDSRSNIDLALTANSEGLVMVDPRTGTLLQTFALPAPALFAPVVDYKNQLASVLLRGSQRAILDLKPLDWGLPATLNIVPFSNVPTRYPISNTVYDPATRHAMNLSFDQTTDKYEFIVTGSQTGDFIWYYPLLHVPHPRITIDAKSSEAKVHTVDAHEYIFRLTPLSWGSPVVYSDIGPLYSWRYSAGFGFYHRFQVGVSGLHHVSIISTYTAAVVDTLHSAHPILGPPVVDAQNQYARIRLASGYSLFLDLFELAKGNPNYYRYDFNGPDLVDEPLFDPIGGMDLTLDSNNQLKLWRSRAGVLVASLNLPARPVRPLKFDPHNRVLEAIMPNGTLYHVDLSHVDGTTPASLNLQPVALGGVPLASSDVTPPPAANTNALVVSAAGADGVVKITAPPGTVEANAFVTLGNLNDRSVELAEVMANTDGSFVAYALADSADTVCVMTADVAGNYGPDACFKISTTNVDVIDSDTPLATALFAPTPNPSRGSVLIPFALAKAGRVRLAVHDLAGRKVRAVLDGWLEAGSHGIRWDGRNDRAQMLPAGYYFLKFAADNREFVKRVIRIGSN